MRGDAEEKKAEKELKAMGYQTFRVKRMVIKVAGFYRLIGNDIFDCFDIFAMNETDIKLVSVKRGYPSREHRDLIKTIKCPSNVSKEIWKWISRKPWKIYKGEGL